MKVEAKQGQSFLDLVIQATGDVDNAFAMALANGRNLTDPVGVGETFEVRKQTRKTVTALFDETNKPATAPTMAVADIVQQPVGIGEMVIEDTFIISAP